MKQTKLKRIALPALAVLIAVFVLAGTAAGGGETTTGLTQSFELPSEGDNPKHGIYYMESLKGADGSGTGYWIPKNADNVFLGVKIDGLQQNVLTAYNIEIKEDSTNTGAGFTNLDYSISNLGLSEKDDSSTSSGIGNKVTNGYNYAFTHSKELNNAYSGSPTDSLFKIALKGSKASSEKYYQIDISGKASVAGSESSKINDWSTEEITVNNFKFYVLEIPVINKLTIYNQHDGTFGDNQQPTFYLYAENTGAEYAVDAGIENYINGVHKISWTVEGNSISIDDSSGSNSTKVKVTGKTGDATLKISIKDLAGSEKKATVKVENWKSGVKDNKLDAASITSDTGWNFKNNRVITYTVKPGMPGFNNASGSQNEFSTGWDTWVQVPALTGGNDKLRYDKNWLNEDAQTSNSNDVKGMTVSGGDDNNIITLKDGWGNFTVLKGSAADKFDSSKTVTITLTGYRLGDVNTNSDVDITDSALIGMIVAEIITDDATDENKIYADCNKQGGDGDIDVADILALNKYIVGYKTIKDWAQQATTT